MTTLFNKPDIQMPKPTPPPRMPDPFSPESLEAKRRTMADAAMGGRAASTLTTAGSRAAGTIAGSTKLGAA